MVGYAIGRRVDACLALAALRAAIAMRQPPSGCIHHSDRGSQYAAEDYRAELEKHGFKGSMGRRGNPHAELCLGQSETAPKGRLTYAH